MNKFTENFYQEGVGFDSIREQREAQGVDSQPVIEQGKGVVMTMNNGNEIHKAGEWYVYKDGQYSFMSHEKLKAINDDDPDNLIFDDYTLEGKYNVVGIVPFDTDAVKDGTTRIMYFYSVNEQPWCSDTLSEPINGSVEFGWCSDFDGYTKTKNLKKYAEENESNFEITFPAAYTAYSFKAFEDENNIDITQWYLPAIGELALMGMNSKVLVEEFDTLGLEFPLENSFFSVSEFYDETCIIYTYYSGVNISDINGTDDYMSPLSIIPFALVGNISSIDGEDDRKPVIPHTPDSTISEPNNPNPDDKIRPKPGLNPLVP
ncbi:MAG: hypothetical protein J6X18_12590 [Bacteroidales bacterium]|nr:hypothetical protein [Bacteroidales bacterium]